MEDRRPVVRWESMGTCTSSSLEIVQDLLRARSPDMVPAFGKACVAMAEEIEDYLRQSDDRLGCDVVDIDGAWCRLGECKLPAARRLVGILRSVTPRGVRIFGEAGPALSAELQNYCDVVDGYAEVS